jgi:hypothetical protein
MKATLESKKSAQIIPFTMSSFPERGDFMHDGYGILLDFDGNDSLKFGRVNMATE